MTIAIATGLSMDPPTAWRRGTRNQGQPRLGAREQAREPRVKTTRPILEHLTAAHPVADGTRTPSAGFGDDEHVGVDRPPQPGDGRGKGSPARSTAAPRSIDRRVHADEEQAQAADGQHQAYRRWRLQAQAAGTPRRGITRARPGALGRSLRPAHEKVACSPTNGIAGICPPVSRIGSPAPRPPQDLPPSRKCAGLLAVIHTRERSSSLPGIPPGLVSERPFVPAATAH